MGVADRVRVSRRLSYVLRHAPESIGLALGEGGWVRVDELLAALAMHRLQLSRPELLEVVRANDKQRFALDETGELIRASQGHWVRVDLGYQPRRPPRVLYHGTPERNVAQILAEGLKRGQRHAVHLSPDVATASAVGARRGRFVVLRVDAAALAAAGATFTVSDNGVWLVDAVPAKYLSVAGATG